MAKRRNQKKEKALRNQAYARKFRKRPSTGRGMGGRRRFGGDNNAQDMDDMEENKGGNEGAADT
jgi:hypothetical protein